MKRLTENKIVLVVRRSRLDDLIIRHNTFEQAHFCVSQTGADFSDYELEDKIYKRAIRTTEQILHSLGRVQILNRDFLPNFIFGEEDTVIVLGQDGLVANTMKYLNRQPVIGVNPDPERYDGILLPFRVKNLTEVIKAHFAKKMQMQNVTMAEVLLSDGQKLYAVNDFFIGAKSHVSARYEISHCGKKEFQSSSGIIISTGLGSTGWLKSVFAGAGGILQSLTGENPFPLNFEHMTPDSRFLFYSVREPFPGNKSGTSIVFGKVDKKNKLMITSGMSENGVIFSDGIEEDFLTFNSGTIATISVSQKAGNLVKA